MGSSSSVEVDVVPQDKAKDQVPAGTKDKTNQQKQEVAREQESSYDKLVKYYFCRSEEEVSRPNQVNHVKLERNHHYNQAEEKVADATIAILKSSSFSEFINPE